MTRIHSIILLLLGASLFVGCSTKQSSIKSKYGPFTGTFMVHSEDDFPVSLFLDDRKDCFYKGYVKKYDNNTERFSIKINKEICQNGATKDVDGYVYDEYSMPGVKSLTVGTKVEMFIIKR